MKLKEEEYLTLLDKQIKKGLYNLYNLLNSTIREKVEANAGFCEQIKGTMDILEGLILQKERLPHMKEIYEDKIMYFLDETTGEIGYIGLDEEEWEIYNKKEIKTGQYV